MIRLPLTPGELSDESLAIVHEYLQLIADEFHDLYEDCIHRHYRQCIAIRPLRCDIVCAGSSPRHRTPVPPAGWDCPAGRCPGVAPLRPPLTDCPETRHCHERQPHLFDDCPPF